MKGGKKSLWDINKSPQLEFLWNYSIPLTGCSTASQGAYYSRPLRLLAGLAVPNSSVVHIPVPLLPLSVSLAKFLEMQLQVEGSA